MSAAMRRALRAAARATSTRALATSSLLPFPAPRVTVVYTPKAIDAEVRRVFFSGSGDADPETSPSSSLRLIGFDIEHKPETRKGAAPSVHLVQITSPDGAECLLLHVAAAGLSAMTERQTTTRVPHLVRLLGDARVVAAGVGVRGDLDRLRRSHAALFRVAANEPHERSAHAGVAREEPVSSMRSLDAQAVHMFYHPEAAGASVARLAAEHALATSAQSKSVTMSDWSAAPLSPAQIAYAAEDAALSFRIAERQFERYAPAGTSFAEWAECFLGVDTAPAMDARAAEIVKRAARTPTRPSFVASVASSVPSVPRAMLDAFEAHHGAVTQLRAARANASRWRAATVAVAKFLADAPGFSSAVSALDVLCAATARGAEDTDARDAWEADARVVRVRYEHSETSRSDIERAAGTQTREDAFSCRATAELRLGDARRLRTLVFEGYGRSKRAAKDAAARRALAAVRSELDGVWMCSRAAEWVAERFGDPNRRTSAAGAGGRSAARDPSRSPLRCALGCGGAGAALMGPRDKNRAGVAQPAHFEDEAGWASCARRRGRREHGQ